MLIAIGHDPRSELFTSQLDLDDNGYLRTQAPNTGTSAPGVFACGDVVDHTCGQVVTAAGPGAAAAIDAARHLAAQR